jgi:hypothetical protein
VYDKWSRQSVAALVAASPGNLAREVLARARASLVARATRFLRAAEPTARLEVVRTGAYLVRDGDGDGRDDSPVRTKLADLPLSAYYACGAAAHTAMCEARAPGYNASLVVVQDVPPSAQPGLHAVFAALLAHKQGLTVVMCAPHAGPTAPPGPPAVFVNTTAEGACGGPPTVVAGAQENA